MEQEKDNFWIYIGGVIAVAITLTVLFKGTHKEAIPDQAYAETSKQIDGQIAKTKQQK